jgi:Zn-finger nucleic acid-binding protein
MARMCPDCDLELELRDFNGVSLDVCTRCAGIFFDEGEVGAVHAQGEGAFSDLDEMARPAEPFTADGTHRLRVCPGCQHGMSPYRYLYASPIVLDACDKCGGLWIENGELRMMAEYSRGDHGMRTPEAAVAQLQAETEGNIGRMKIAERTTRALNRRLRGGWRPF